MVPFRDLCSIRPITSFGMRIGSQILYLNNNEQETPIPEDVKLDYLILDVFD